MLPRSIHRLLDPVHPDVVFQSNDPEDPRMGDLLLSLSDAAGARGLVCVLVGVPQHIGVERNNGRPGAAEAPNAIRKMLYRMATSAIQTEVQDDRLVVTDAGNLVTQGKTLEQIHDELHDVVAGLMRSGAIPIVLGGGHDSAWPTLRAYETIGKPFGVVNIDAHADVRPLQPGSRAHSGSPFRQLLDAPHSKLHAGAFVEFGLQPHAVAMAHLEYVLNRGMHAVMLEEARKEGAWERCMARVAAAETMHVSLDMDAFASAFAPGVSAPSSDGFTPSEVADFLVEAGARPQLTSFDVVEVSPPFDVDNRTSKLAATMIMCLLAGIARRVRNLAS